jgi:predicted TIM-barrel fold metal-dependent hydrolase
MSGRIDVHTHYLAEALLSALEARDELPRISTAQSGHRIIEYGHGNAHPLLPEMIDVGRQLSDMKEWHIDQRLLTVNIPGADFFRPEEGIAVSRDVNDELADLARRHPDQLAALALLPMQAPEQAAIELQRAVSAGLRGALLFSNIAGRNLDEAEFRVVFDTAAKLDVPVMVHPTYPLSARLVDAYALIPTIAFLFDTTAAALRLILDGLYERHPDFKLILCHAGSFLPHIIGRIDYEASRDPEGMGALTVPPSQHIRRLYTDTVCVWPAAIRTSLDLFGADRVMFGSDYPFWDPLRTIEALEQTPLSAREGEAVNQSTAERLFGLIPAS